jgi:uncharacterized protein
MNSREGIIKALNLEPHPEGGYFKETYRSVGEITADSLPKAYGGKRNYSTSIYFLLTSDNFSSFHRIKQDETWHFYDGSPMLLHVIDESGEHSKIVIGRDLSAGQVPQYVVKGGQWFAAEVINENDFSFVGCTVAPGFSFEDFELKSEAELTSLFPHQKEVIAALTHH